MEQINTQNAEKMFEAVKSMLRVVDPELESKLELKGLEGGTRYLELPGCFFIKLGLFFVHRVYMYSPGSTELVEVLCTRTYPTNGEKAQTMTTMELLEAMDRMRYLWLPQDSQARQPNYIRPNSQCALEIAFAKSSPNSILSRIARKQGQGPT